MILGNRKNCDVTVKNLGVPDCILANGRITGFIAVSPSWSVDIDSGTFTESTTNAFIQDHTFIPVLGAVEAVNGTPEATTEEYQGGVMSVVRNGLPMFTFKFLKGWSYARALYSMNSFQSYKVLLVFEDGSVAGALNGTTLSGYTIGMLNTGTYFHTDGAVSGYVNTVIQLTSTDEYNLNTYVIDRTESGFDANQLNPITDITLTGRADASDNKIYIKAKFTQNLSSNLLGLAISNLKAYVGGVSDTITAITYNSSTEEYALTPTTAVIATTPTWVVQLYDSVNTVAVAKVGTRYYEGATSAIVPIA
jgi:hypothetical protein